MAFQGTKKPPAEGKITAAINAKNIGIDDMTLMITDDKVTMFTEMNLVVGEPVQYRRVGQGPDKGKVNFLGRSHAAGTQPASQPAAVPAEPVKELRPPKVVTGKYVNRTSNTVTIKSGDDNIVYTADMDLILYLGGKDNKVLSGDMVKVRLVDTQKGYIAKDIGPADPEFKTGKEILAENLATTKTTPAKSEPTPEQVKQKEDAAADAKMKENAEYAKDLANCENLKGIEKIVADTKARKAEEEKEKAPATLVKSEPSNNANSSITGNLPVSQDDPNDTVFVELELTVQINKFRPAHVKVSGNGIKKTMADFKTVLEAHLEYCGEVSARYPRFD